MKTLTLSLVAGLILGLSLTARAGTLEDVQQRGTLSCGVSTGLAGFSQKDENGNWSGLDVDVCRAVAAAVLGDAGPSLISLTNGGHAFLVDANQAGVEGIAPFSDGLGDRRALAGTLLRGQGDGRRQ